MCVLVFKSVDPKRAANGRTLTELISHPSPPCHHDLRHPQNTQIRIDLDHALECVTLTSPTGSTLLLHLSPPTELLERRKIDLYNSTVSAFDMGDSAAEWFTEACAAGRSVRLVYLGDGTRPVLGSMGDGLQEGRYAALDVQDSDD